MSYHGQTLSSLSRHFASLNQERQMNQALLELPVTQPHPADRCAFDIGWDHARHGLVPPAELLLPSTPVCQGWMAAKAVFGRRTLASTRHTRQWMALRLRAWREGAVFDDQAVTPNYLGQIETAHCPVLRTALGGAAGSPDAAVIERINVQAGYAAGNLVMMSAKAASARRGVDLLQATRLARHGETTGESTNGLHASAWWRLAALLSFAQVLPLAEAAALPMAMMPPNRVRLLNAAQGLQALLTQTFLSKGWSTRCLALAQKLPAHTLRQDFNLFVGAMAPRVLEADEAPRARRLALEDAWLHERVQRRWQHLILSLGAAGTQMLLNVALDMPWPGLLVQAHSTEQATECWGLTATLPTPADGIPAASRAGLPSRVTNRVTGSSGNSAARPRTNRSSRPERAQPPAAPRTHA